MVQTKLPIVGEHSDVRFAKLACPPELANATFAVMMEESATVLKGKDGELPSASTNPGMPFAALAQQVREWSAGSGDLAVVQHPIRPSTDPVSDIDDLPKEHWDAFASRLRLDALKAFWVNLVSADVDSALKRTKSAEEKAVLLLTRNDVPAACNVLVAAKNFRLASLVAQLPASAANRQVMQRQIDAWQKRKDWSEMSDAVRALYSIFAGSVCRVAGQSGASEDRASEFCVAERFAMTWRQSLGLRVYFGGHETLEEAVEAYCVDLETGRETVEPASPHGNGGEDTLLTLCRLYASEAGDVDAAVLCEPTTVSGSALNPRVAWQLSSLLSAKGLIVLPENKLASITLDLAATLETSAKLVESVWVLLHLGGAERQRAISGLLQRNARDLADVEEQLVQECRIPPPMISAARSLHAKAVGDTHGQVQLLLRAGNLAEAHEVLCTTVGPQAVIERDHDALALVSEFPRQRPAGWDKGGQIYEAYMRLALMSQGQKQSEEGEKVVRALRRGLRGVEEAGMQGKTLEQRVAVLEMRRFVEQIAKARGDERRMGKVEDGGVGAGAAMLDKYRSAVGLVL
ncbi:hypothetical protein LTR91_003765 [Friedmanniomyces endolithicus]|uniref:Nuclear pore complex protein NUP96 C-terminal domain-containing protein n=1 Tax=Friedmanniomyces endolithicus TaxID=329885 RepID=A0AAN6KZ26_9PEZI|nr:hypothetical protein LTR91_003765 [Friedmanniomyces endolithicus]